MAKLNDKQQRFVDEYMVDFNATQAAIRAGYSEVSARSQGCQLLTKLNIREAVYARMKELGANCGITREKIIEMQMDAINISRGLKPVIVTEKFKNFDQETVEDVEKRIVDLNAYNKGISQLAKMVGEDGTNKVDITSNGNEVQSGVLIVHEVAESDDAWANAKKDDKESIQ